MFRQIILCESQSLRNLILSSLWNWIFVLVTISEFKTPEDYLSLNQYGAMMINSLYWQFLTTKIIPLPANLVLSSLFLTLTTLFQFIRSINYHFMTERTEHGHSLRLKKRLQKFEELSKSSEEKGQNWFRSKKLPTEPNEKSEN